MKKCRKFLSLVCPVLLFALILAAGAVGLTDFLYPDSLSLFRGESLPGGGLIRVREEETLAVGQYATASRASVSLFGILPVKEIRVNTFEDLKLIPGGDVFGIRIALGGALITGISEIGTEDGGSICPARAAGLRQGDLILSVDGTAVGNAWNFSELIAECGGKSLTLRVRRGKEELTISLTPRQMGKDNRYRAGIWVRDTAAGIGTVTFADAATGAFGGLGHGVYDPDSGALLPLVRGTVLNVGLSGVLPGTAGDPGELQGHLLNEKTGSLLSNTDCGVFGVFSSLPERMQKTEAVPIALSSSVKPGPAEILCTLENGVRKRYRIEITEIRRGKEPLTKNFSIRVTDEELLAATGGIVQGMSGSPILQDGHLVGAVTHVLINDPTAGYGIFIENMLFAMPDSIRP